MTLLASRPNILLITTDQQRGDCLGIAGHPVLSTPNLDQLAREGTLFLRGYSESPTCIPARLSLMSGQSPAAHGMVGMRDSVEWDPPATLAGCLSNAGYQTELVGKLHFYPRRKRYGFQHMQIADGTGSYGAPNDYVDWLREKGHTGVEPATAHGVSGNGWVARPSNLPEEFTHTNWCVERAVQFVDRRDPSVPFFLNVSFHAPHPPLVAPQFYYDRYLHMDLPEPVVGDWAPALKGPEKGQTIDAHEVWLDRETMRRCRAAYYAMINHVDDQIGRLLNHLQRRALLDNTFILFTSDHGEMLGDHRLFRKSRPYEAAARVPFLARPQRHADFPSRLRVDAPVGLQDVMPTLLDAAGVDVPPSVTGRSLLPLMRGQSPADVSWRDVLHGEHAAPARLRDHSMHYLVDSRTKYVWYSHTGREHLFDLAADPNELHDLAAAPGAEDRLASWRSHLAAVLRGRPEGFSDGDSLIPGRPHEVLVS